MIRGYFHLHIWFGDYITYINWFDKLVISFEIHNVCHLEW